MSPAAPVKEEKQTQQKEDSNQTFEKDINEGIKEEKHTRLKSTNKQETSSKKDKEIKEQQVNPNKAGETLSLLLSQKAKEQAKADVNKKEQEKEQELALKKVEAAVQTIDFKLNPLPTFKKKTETSEKQPGTLKQTAEPTTKDLAFKDIKLADQFKDDLIIQLVKSKQKSASDRIRPKRFSEINISPLVIKNHIRNHKNQTAFDCDICRDSQLGLDIEEIVGSHQKPDETDSIIIGENIFKQKATLVNITKKEELNLVIESNATTIQNDKVQKTIKDFETKSSPKPQAMKPSKQTTTVEQESAKGIIRYALSDRTFIDKGWTMLPTEKVVRKMNVYRMRPAHPEFDWFEHNKNKRQIMYDTGERLAEFDDNGRGRWYYRNGMLALDYYDAEETNAQQRFVVYSNGEPDERGRSRPRTVLATFDYLGNGIVFDHKGKLRLKYNQTEGVVLDREIGPVTHWKWHTLNDPPVLQQVMIDTQMPHKDPAIMKLGPPNDNKSRPDNEEMLAIEFDNFIKEKSKKLTQKFKPFQIKMKALKINENFSLRVLDQASVYLLFRDGTTNLKINIGMVLDHTEIVDTDTAEVGEVSNNLERLPARTDSLAGLQRSVAQAQRLERVRVVHELRLRPAGPCASADRLTAAASRPMRPPLQTDSCNAIPACSNCPRKHRKPCLTNLYYDTRIL